MDALLDLKNKFSALQKPNAIKVDVLRVQISDLIASVEFACLDLNDLLTKADQSTFMKGDNWVTTFTPAIQRIQAAANDLSNPKGDLKTIGAALNRIVTETINFDHAIREKLEAEVKLHLPA